jgi:hypothetical protein
MQPHGPVPVPGPQGGGLIALLAAGKPEPDLQHQVSAGPVGSGRDPRALAPWLEQLPDPQRPPVSQAGHHLRQASDPAAQPSLTGRGPGQVAGHHESLHERTLPAPGHDVK